MKKSETEEGSWYEKQLLMFVIAHFYDKLSRNNKLTVIYNHHHHHHQISRLSSTSVSNKNKKSNEATPREFF